MDSMLKLVVYGGTDGMETTATAMREWVTNPKENFGMMFFPPPNDEDQASFVSFLDPDANERPRLSLSCHGDKSDAYESVFIERTKKEQKSSLVENIDNMTQQDFKQPI
eukprot:g11226.t1